jgi:hypothetical protein
MKKFLFFLFLILVNLQVMVLAQSFVPGSTYYGRKNYTEYHPGNSPLIFSAPHGGNVSPAIIPDRTCNTPVLVADANTSDLAMRIDSACMIVFGCHPHIIICNMSRKKVDCNRIEADGTCGNSEADIAWTDFHSFLDTAEQTVMAQYGKGFYIDLHGHGHPIQRLEMGYLVHANELRMADSVLDKAADTLRFGLHNLWNINKTTLTLTQLMRGSTSIGTLLALKGYPAVPSQQDPFPQPADPYFDGGYNTDRYSSANGGTIDGLQIEHNFTGVRDTYHNRAVYADTLVRVLKNFLLRYYFNPATLAACQLITTTQEESLSFPELLLFPNPAIREVNLKFNTLQTSINIRMVDAAGQLVMQKSVFHATEVILPLQTVPSGCYSLLIQTSQQQFSRKLIVMPR